MSNLKLKSVGDLRTASDNRQFYAATFQDATNIFAPTSSRMFWQQKNAEGVCSWKGADHAQATKAIGSSIPGAIVTREVQPYMIGDRSVKFYTCVVLANEAVEKTFNSLGHKFPGAVAVAPVLAAGDVVII